MMERGRSARKGCGRCRDPLNSVFHATQPGEQGGVRAGRNADGDVVRVTVVFLKGDGDGSHDCGSGSDCDLGPGMEIGAVIDGEFDGFIQLVGVAALEGEDEFVSILADLRLMRRAVALYRISAERPFEEVADAVVVRVRSGEGVGAGEAELERRAGGDGRVGSFRLGVPIELWQGGAINWLKSHPQKRVHKWESDLVDPRRFS